MRKAAFVNYTPHDIVIYDGDEVAVTFPKSGSVARVEVSTTASRSIHIDDDDVSVPVVSVTRGNVEGIDAWDGSFPIIVSLLAADVLTEEGRGGNVYYPDTGPDSAVRNADGQILGVRRLVCAE